MSSYGLIPGDAEKVAGSLMLEEVKEVIREYELNIVCEHGGPPCGDKYIIEAEGPGDKYCLIILCASDDTHGSNINSKSIEDYRNGVLPEKLLDPEHDPFYSAIVKTRDLERELRDTGVHNYDRVKKLIEGWNIKAVNNYANPFGYKIVVGLLSGTELAPNPLDKESLKEAITHILGFGEIIGALIEEKQKRGE